MKKNLYFCQLKKLNLRPAYIVIYHYHIIFVEKLSLDLLYTHIYIYLYIKNKNGNVYPNVFTIFSDVIFLKKKVNK